MDDIRRAYAVFGLEPGASYLAIKKRYRTLVKTWHPDRFTGDPQGQAEASVRMRAINAAHETLVNALESGPMPSASYESSASQSNVNPADAAWETPPQTARPTRQWQYGQRLPREDIDAIVNAIGTESFLDSFLGMFGWVGSTFHAVCLAAMVVGIIVRMVMLSIAALQTNWGAVRESVDLILMCAVVAVLALQEYRARRRMETATRDDSTAH